jgi:hypothetical protein
MLTPDNSKEIQAFGLQSLEPMLSDAITSIMASTDLMMSCFSVIDYYNFPYEIQQSQFRLLESMASRMTEARATDIIKRQGLSRLMKAYPNHNPKF